MSDPAPASAPAPNGTGMIPYDRFQAVVEEKNRLSTRLTELERQAQTYAEKAATADTLANQLRQAQAQAQAAESRFASFQAIAKHNITDPGLVELVEWQHSKLPAENRPSLDAWLGQIKADPNQAPVALRHLFQGTGGHSVATPGTIATPGQPAVAPAPGAAPTGAAAPGPTAAQPTALPGFAAQPRPMAPNPNVGVQPTTTAPAVFTAEQIRNMKPHEVLANLPAIQAATGVNLQGHPLFSWMQQQGGGQAAPALPGFPALPGVAAPLAVPGAPAGVPPAAPAPKV